MDLMNAKGFETKDKYQNLMVVDFLNLCFRFRHKNQRNFADEAVNTVRSLGNSYLAKDIVIAGDWGSSWRKEIYPEYKANREALREKQTTEEGEAFKDFLTEVDRAMTMLKEYYIVLRFKGCEADDIAAYIATRYETEFNHIWLISTDKDWDLLISGKVSRFSYVTRKEITMATWASHYDYSVDAHISVKVLQGDSGDNIHGVAGVGAKRAAQLVAEYGTAFDIYDALPINNSYKYIQNLNAFGDKLLLNYELMDLRTYCDTALGSANCSIIDEIFE